MKDQARIWTGLSYMCYILSTTEALFETPIREAKLLHPSSRSHLQTLKIYKPGFDQNYYTFTLKLRRKIILCNKFL